MMPTDSNLQKDIRYKGTGWTAFTALQEEHSQLEISQVHSDQDLLNFEFFVKITKINNRWRYSKRDKYGAISCFSMLDVHLNFNNYHNIYLDCLRNSTNLSGKMYQTLPSELNG